MGGTADQAALFFRGRHALVSFAHRSQAKLVAEVCQSFCLDNGAFSIWKKGGELNIDKLYDWYESMISIPSCDWAIIPDVIAGTEQQNDELIETWPFSKSLGVPVWHYHESLERLARLCNEWPRVALGSSGQWPTPGTPSWWGRTAEAMSVACNEDGSPKTKLHGLRMLAPKIFNRMPLASADSTNAVRNARDGKAWSHAHKPPTDRWRATVIAERIESRQSAARWIGPRKAKPIRPATDLFQGVK